MGEVEKVKPKKEWKERIMKTKWDSLKKRGYHPPESYEENFQRAKDAHGY